MLMLLKSAKTISEIKEDKIGNYTKEEVSRIFDEVLKMSYDGEQPNIYI